MRGKQNGCHSHMSSGELLLHLQYRIWTLVETVTFYIFRDGNIISGKIGSPSASHSGSGHCTVADPELSEALAQPFSAFLATAERFHRSRITQHHNPCSQHQHKSQEAQKEPLEDLRVCWRFLHQFRIRIQNSARRTHCISSSSPPLHSLAPEQGSGCSNQSFAAWWRPRPRVCP